MALALWTALLGAIAGALAGIFGAESIGLAHTFHVSEGVGFFGAVLGLVVGAVGGFLFVYQGLLSNPWLFIGDLISGLVVTLVILAVMLRFEDQLQRFRGYRELSGRERQLLDPLLDEMLGRMNIEGARPTLYISPSKKPSAWTNARSIVLAEGLLGEYGPGEQPPKPDLPANALTAILAHEVHHWKRGDALAIRAVWCAFWPIVALYDLAHYLQEERGWIGWFGLILLWPTWVCVKLIVIPVMAKAMREGEYEADQAAAALGEDVRSGLRTALTELSAWEAPRTGWEDAISATHPQIELRLEKLQAPPPAPPPDSVVTVAAGTPDALALRGPGIRKAALEMEAADNGGDVKRRARAERNLERAILQRFKQARAAMDAGEPDELKLDRDELDSRIVEWEGRVKSASAAPTRQEDNKPEDVQGSEPYQEGPAPTERASSEAESPAADVTPDDDQEDDDAGTRWQMGAPDDDTKRS